MSIYISFNGDVWPLQIFKKRAAVRFNKLTLLNTVLKSSIYTLAVHVCSWWSRSIHTKIVSKPRPVLHADAADFSAAQQTGLKLS